MRGLDRGKTMLDAPMPKAGNIRMDSVTGRQLEFIA
jgi:hypothetical protein